MKGTQTTPLSPVNHLKVTLQITQCFHSSDMMSAAQASSVIYVFLLRWRQVWRDLQKKRR